MANPASSVAPNPILTPEAYLLPENNNGTGIRHEYVNGLIYAMTGARRNHNHVIRRLMSRLDHFQGSCEKERQSPNPVWHACPRAFIPA